MTEYGFKQAVLARILAADFLTDEMVDVPNSTAFHPPESGLWCRVSFSGSQGIFAGFGDRPCTRRSGMVMIQCFMRGAQYTQPVEELAQKLAALLEWHFAEGYELQAAQVADAGLSDDGLWYQKNINVPFLIKAV